MKIRYTKRRFQETSLPIIRHANEILSEYAEQGFVLTLRQLFYQFVSRGIIENNLAEYKSLGRIIAGGRDAGLIDWDAIFDITRELRTESNWDESHSAVSSICDQFRVGRWEGQPNVPEVWIEKDALIGVFSGVCSDLDVPLLSTRGYPSQSVVWEASQRILRRAKFRKQLTTVLYFGDHDPTGVDITRDLRDRLKKYEAPIQVKRVAMSKTQAKKHKCPPMMAKKKDARTRKYEKAHGSDCWELDGIPPNVLVSMAQTEILKLRDDAIYRRRKAFENSQLKHLTAIRDNWDDLVSFLGLRDGTNG